MLINNDLPIIPLPAVGYIRPCQVDECKCSWNLNLLNVRSSINKNWQHSAMNFESEKADSKFTKKRLHRHLCAFCEWHIWEKFTSPDPGLSVWEEFHLVLTAQECGVSSHKVYGYRTMPFCTLSHTWRRADGQPLPAQHQDAMVKWEMKQINSGVSYGEPQHNMIMTTNPLKRWGYPQRGASLNECRLVWLTNRLLN